VALSSVGRVAVPRACGAAGIITGMLTQAVALAGFAVADPVIRWTVAAALLGLGTATANLTLPAAVGGVDHPTWRARAVGVYRRCRDGGFAVGAMLGGAFADLAGIRAAVRTVAGLTAASGLTAWNQIYETRRPTGPASTRVQR
jgi:MFS family permease